LGWGSRRKKRMEDGEMGRWGDGEMGRSEDGEIRRWGDTHIVMLGIVENTGDEHREVI
jgi:hypothetical protein